MYLLFFISGSLFYSYSLDIELPLTDLLVAARMVTHTSSSEVTSGSSSHRLGFFTSRLKETTNPNRALVPKIVSLRAVSRAAAFFFCFSF